MLTSFDVALLELQFRLMYYMLCWGLMLLLILEVWLAYICVSLLSDLLVHDWSLRLLDWLEFKEPLIFLLLSVWNPITEGIICKLIL